MRRCSLSKQQSVLERQIGSRRKIVLQPANAPVIEARMQQEGVEIELDGVDGRQPVGRSRNRLPLAPPRPQDARGFMIFRRKPGA